MVHCYFVGLSVVDDGSVGVVAAAAAGCCLLMILWVRC